MISSIPPASIVTMIRSPIPAIPSPMLTRNPLQVMPSVNPMTPQRARPMVSTVSTFTPITARMMTER